jgi:hypothetical protein
MKNLLSALVLLLLLHVTFIQDATAQMDLETMQEVFEDMADNVKKDGNSFEIQYKGLVLLAITDPASNRMRIILPIVEVKELKKKQLAECMEANFDRALDVKYALYNEVVWSVFAHPLEELTEEQLEDAVNQVYNAGVTFGGSYTSTNLVFGGGSEE